MDLDATPSQVLISLFDFAGEMTTRSIDISVLRRRALMMDGSVFFLDPTRPTEEHSLQQAELQRSRRTSARCAAYRPRRG